MPDPEEDQDALGARASDKLRDFDWNEKSGCRIYRISNAWKWFFYIFGLSAVALPSAALYIPFKPGSHFQPGATIGWEVFVGGFMILFVGRCFSGLKSRVEVDANEIRVLGLFTTKRMALADIQGFKILRTQYGRKLVLLPRTGHGRKIKLDLIYERQADLIAWANHTLKNLDAVEYEAELDEIYNEETLGSSPEEKADNFKRARKWCRILNLTSILISYWGFIWPRPYHVVIWVLVASPIASLLLLKRFKGIVKLDARRGSAYPTVTVPFISPPAVLALRALADWHVLDWHGFWGPFALISLALLSLTILSVKDASKKLVTGATYAIFVALSGYGATVTLNGVLADSPSMSFHARVINKHFATGQHPFYYLTVSPWGPRKNPADVLVSRTVYNEYPVGGSATVYVRMGKFGIPYYFVR